MVVVISPAVIFVSSVDEKKQREGRKGERSAPLEGVKEG